MSDFAISTSWNALKYDKAGAVIDEIVSAGYDSIELYFSFTQQMFDEVVPLVRDKRIKVWSLHNYCPVPEGVKRNQASPDYYSLASLDDEERRLAVHFTKKTIEAASVLGAKAVVLHCGKVKIKDRTRRLIDLYEEGKVDSVEFKRIKNGLVQARQDAYKPHLEGLLRSLEGLEPFARNNGVLLGIENRFYVSEMPSFKEIGMILENFRGSSVRHWHDIGHALVLQNLGFIQHEDFLNYKSDLVGIHLHDVKGCRDHIAPGKGTFDFSALKPYVDESVIKVIELNKTQTIEDARYAREYLEGIFRN